jgi:pimeloyl-ACP methyl ester carboxylesterase
MLIPSRGHQIFAERAGSGRPLILIHGLGTPSVWSRVRSPLAASFDVVSIHLPGFGSSPPPKAPLSASGHASLIEGVLEAIDVRDAVLCGMSYGGQIAACLAARAPERVSSLVLVCASGLVTRYRWLRREAPFRLLQFAAAATVFRSEQSIRRWNGRLYADPANQPEEVVREFFRMVSEPERRRSWFQCLRNAAAPEPGFAEDLRRIRMPARIIWGNNDRVVSVRSAAAYRERIADAELRIFDRCGHAIPLECPEELCASLREFLAR